MRANSKSTSKIDIDFEFQQVRLAVAFPCSISLKVVTNHSISHTSPVIFDNVHHVADINAHLKTTIVVHPNQDNLISILPIIHTDSGQKYAGKIFFDVYKAIMACAYQQTMFLEQCPDKTATLNFKFSYSNIRETLIETSPGVQNSTNNSMSFYTSFNHIIDQAMGQIPKGAESNARINKGASPGPNAQSFSSRIQSGRLAKTKESVFVYEESGSMDPNDIQGKENVGIKQLTIGAETIPNQSSMISEHSKGNLNLHLSSPEIEGMKNSSNISPTQPGKFDHNNSSGLKSETDLLVSADPRARPQIRADTNINPLNLNDTDLIKTVAIKIAPDNQHSFEKNSITSANSLSNIKDPQTEAITSELKNKPQMTSKIIQEMTEKTREIDQLKEKLRSLQTQQKKSEQNFKDSYEELTLQNEQLKRKLELNLVSPEENRVQTLELEIREKQSQIKHLESELATSEDKRTELKKRLYEAETAWVTERQTYENAIKDLESRLFQFETKEDFVNLHHVQEIKAQTDKIKALEELVQIEKHRANFLNQKFETHNEAYLALEKTLASEKSRCQQINSENESLKLKIRVMSDDMAKLNDELSLANDRKESDLLQIEEEKQRFMQEIYELKILIKDIIEEKQRLLGSEELISDNNFENQLQSIKDSVNFSDLQDNELKRLNEIITDLKESIRVKEEEFKQHCAVVQKLHNEQVEQYQKEVSDLREQLEEARTASDSATSQRNAAFERLDALIKENYESAQTIFKMKGDLEKFKTDNDKLIGEKKTSSEEMEKLKVEMELLATGKAQLENEMEKQKSEKSNEASSRQALLDEIGEFKKKVEDLESQLNEMVKLKEQALEDFEGQKYENEVLVEEAETLEKEVTDLKQQIEVLTSENQNHLSAINGIESELKERKEQEEHWREIATKLGKDLATVSTTYQTNRQTQQALIAELQKHRTKLKTQCLALKVAVEFYHQEIERIIFNAYYGKVTSVANEILLERKLKETKLDLESMKSAGTELQNVFIEKERLVMSVQTPNESTQNESIVESFLLAKEIECVSEIFTATIGERESKIQTLVQQLQIAMDSSQQFKRQVDEYSAHLIQTEVVFGNLNEENLLLKNKAAEMNIAMAAKEEMISELNSKLHEAHMALETITAESDTLKEQIGQQSIFMNNFTQQNESLSQSLVELREQQAKLELAYQQLVDSKADSSQQFQDMTSLIDDLKDQLAVQTTQNQVLADEIEHLRSAVDAKELVVATKDMKLTIARNSIANSVIQIERIGANSLILTEDLLRKILAMSSKVEGFHAISQKITELKSSLQSSKEHNKELQNSLESAETSTVELKNTKVTLEKEVSQLKVSISTYENQIQSLLDGTKSAEETQKEVSEKLRKQLEEAHSTVSKQQETIAELQGQSKALKNKLDEQTENHSAQVKSMEETIVEKENLVQKVKSQFEESNDQRAQLTVKLADLESIKEENIKLKEKLNGQTEKLSKTQQSLEEEVKMNKELSAKMAESSHTIEEQTKTIETKSAEMAQLTNKLESANHRCLELSKELEVLQFEHQNLIDKSSHEATENHKLAKKIAEIEVSSQSLADEIKLLQNQKEELSSNLIASNEKITKLNAELESSIQTSAEKETQIESLSRQLSQINAENNHNKELLVKADDEKHIQISKIQELTADLEKTNKLTESLESELTGAYKTMESLTTQKNDLKNKLETLENQAKNLNMSKEEINLEFAKVSQQYSSAKKDLDQRSLTINDLEARLLAEQANLERAQSRVKSLETDKESLRKENENQSQALAKQKEKEKDLNEKIGHLSHQITESQNHLTAKTNEIADLIAQLESKTQEIISQTFKLEESRKTVENLEKRSEAAENDLVQTKASSQSSRIILEEEIQKLKTDLSQIKIAHEELSKEKAIIISKLHTLENTHKEVLQSKQSLQEKVAKLESDNERLQGENNLFKSELQTQTTQKDDLSNKFLLKKQKIVTVKAQVGELENSLNERSNELENTKIQLSIYTKNCEEMEKDISNYKRRLADMEVADMTSRALISQLQAERDDYLRKIENFNSETKTLLTQTHEKEQDKTMLKIDFEKLETENKMLKEFIEQKDREIGALKNDVAKSHSELVQVNKQLAESNKEVEARQKTIELKTSEEEKLRVKMDKLKLEIQGLNEKLEATRKEKSELSLDLNQAISQMNAVKHQLQIKEAELTNVNNQIQNLTDELKRVNDEHEKLNKSVTTLNTQVENDKVQINALKIEINDLAQAKSGIEKDKHYLELRLKEFTSQSEAQIAALNSALTKSNADHAKEKQQLLGQASTLESKLKDTTEHLERLAIQLADFQNESFENEKAHIQLKSFEVQLQALQDQLSSKEEVIKSYSKENDQLKKQLGDLQHQFDQNINKSSESASLTDQLMKELKEAQARITVLTNTDDKIKDDFSKISKDYDQLNKKYQDEKAQHKQELDQLRKQIPRMEDYIEFAAYQNLEKLYINTMEKIGDALSLIKNMKLKKQDQDRLVEILVSNK